MVQNIQAVKFGRKKIERLVFLEPPGVREPNFKGLMISDLNPRAQELKGVTALLPFAMPFSF